MNALLLEETLAVKYPNIEVDLSGTDGNAFLVIGRVTRALKRAGVKANEIEAYRQKAMSGDYDNVLSTTMDWVEVN